MAWKLLKLTPLKPFFFGKESVFTNTHYASSEYFPQQTQITGALRLYWMEQNGLMRITKTGKYVPIDKQKEAIKLVGDTGSQEYATKDNLGIIKQISPMFVLQMQNDCMEDALFELPSDIVEVDSQKSIANPKILSSVSSSKPVVLLEDYSAKEGFVSGFGGSDFWEAYVDHEASSIVFTHDDIYKPCEQVGIALKEEKQADDGKFYTKKSYELKKDYAFGVLVNIDEDKAEEEGYRLLEDGIISLGADASMFKLEVGDIPAVLATHPVFLQLQNPYERKGTKLVLLSDSILTKSIHDKAFFQIVKHKVPFKMIQGKKHGSQGAKTDETLLVPKGAVYYFSDKETLEKAKCAYKKMGFNYYLVLN